MDAVADTPLIYQDAMDLDQSSEQAHAVEADGLIQKPAEEELYTARSENICRETAVNKLKEKHRERKLRQPSAEYS